MPQSSPIQDLRRMRKNTAATAAELREFLRALRGKTPTEMLGVVASSSLFRSLSIATVGTAALIAVFTVIPFAWGRIFHPAEETPTVPLAAETSENAPVVPEVPEPSLEAPAVPAAPLDALGVGETREAPPRSNPLEGAGDDLLEGLE